MNDKLRFLLNRLSERLWVKPVVICLVSVAVALLAKIADFMNVFGYLPEVSEDSVEKLLTVMSSSMLVIAVFAVGSMIAAYESAARSATPRAFSVVVSDDRSQNALSTFLGAFIFSIVGLVAITNDYYEKGGLFSLLVITLVVFALVILNFLKWVDAIARDGASTIEVMIRLQKALAGLAQFDNPEMRKAAQRQADLAFRHAEQALSLPSDVERLRQCMTERGST